MNPVILYRKYLSTDSEIDGCADKYFNIYNHRTDVPEGSLVIARYCCLPFYRDLEYDLRSRGSKLINSFSQFDYIANLASWYEDLSSFTPKTWSVLSDIPEWGPFILKGQTNSMKHDWDGMMFASNKREAIDIYMKLQKDSLIGQQTIFIRKFVELNSFGTAIGGSPVSEEYRFFILDGKVIASGLYWSNYTDLFPAYCTPQRVPQDFINKVIDRVGDQSRFYVVDVGIKNDGLPIVIELNEGQLSGLSEIDPQLFYKSLHEGLK